MPVQFSVLRGTGIAALGGDFELEFRPGFNAVVPGDDSAVAALTGLLSTALESSESDRVSKALGLGRNQAKLRLEMHASATTLVVQRSLGAAQIAGRISTGTDEPRKLSGDEDVLRALISDLDFSLPNDWRSLCVWHSSAGQWKAAAHAAQDDELEATQDTAALRKQLQVLMEERMMLASMGDVQGQADELQNRLFEIEHRLTEIDKILASRTRADKLIESRKELVQGGKALVDKAKNYEDLRAKFERGESGYQEKKKSLESVVRQYDGVKVWQYDPKLYAAGVVFVLSLVLARFVSQWIALGAIAALGALPYLVWTYLQAGTKLQQARAALEQETKQYTFNKKKYEESVQQILRLQKEYKLLSPEDLAKAWVEVETVQRELQAWDKAHNKTVLEAERKQLLAEQGEKKAKYGKISGALQEASGGMGTLREMDAQIARLKARIEGTAPAAAQAVAATGSRYDPAEDYPAFARALVKIARVSDVASLAATCHERIKGYLPHFMGGRWRAVRLSDEGLQVESGNGEKSRLNDLDSSERWLAMFLARAAAYLALPPERRLPVVLEDPFALLDAPTRATAIKVLAKLGQSMQILLITSNGRDLPADAVLEFGSGGSSSGF